MDGKVRVVRDLGARYLLKMGKMRVRVKRMDEGPRNYWPSQQAWLLRFAKSILMQFFLLCGTATAWTAATSDAASSSTTLRRRLDRNEFWTLPQMVRARSELEMRRYVF